MQGTIKDESSHILQADSKNAGAQTKISTVKDQNAHVSRPGEVYPDVLQDELSQVSNRIKAIHVALHQRVGEQKYRIWFKNSTKLSLSGGYLKIGVPNFFIASWIENHFLKDINQAVNKAVGSKLKISFTIDPELSGNLRRTQLDSTPTIHPDKKNRPGTLSPKSKLSSIGTGKLTLENFVVGPSNELAFNAAKAVVREKHCPFNPLFIHGGYGLGKTHLLQGICNELAKTRLGTNWLYMSAEDFTNQFVLALKLRKLETFRHRMRQADLLAIDDIHFLASKPSTQEEFLHTFNTINLAGKQVVLVSDAHPKMINQLSEKLVSRFVSGMVVKIDTPDFKTRCQICRKFLENAKYPAKSRSIPEAVIRHIAENLRSNVRELEGALLKLIAYSSLQNEKITLSMAQAVLVDHLERCDPIVRISDIESAVTTYFGITPANIHSSKKNKTVALARHFSMYLIRKHTKMSSSEIGRFMGNKNHATVLFACKRVEQLIERNSDINWHGPNGNKITKARTALDHIQESLSG